MLEGSKGQNGLIPLSEVLIFTQHMDLIGTKKEFINIIQQMDNTVAKHLNEVSKRDERRKGRANARRQS